MTSVLYAQILCEAKLAGCRVGYPGIPETYAQRGVVTRMFTGIRQAAAAAGWEVRRGTRYGQDVCPPCRVVLIRQAEQNGGQADR